MPDQKLDAAIKKLIDSGASDDDITFFIQNYKPENEQKIEATPASAVETTNKNQPGFWNRSTAFLRNIGESLVNSGKENSDLLRQGNYENVISNILSPLNPIQMISDKLNSPSDRTESTHQGLGMLGIPSREISEDWKSSNWRGLAGDITGTVLPMLAAHSIGKGFGVRGGKLSEIAEEVAKPKLRLRLNPDKTYTNLETGEVIPMDLGAKPPVKPTTNLLPVEEKSLAAPADFKAPQFSGGGRRNPFVDKIQKDKFQTSNQPKTDAQLSGMSLDTKATAKTELTGANKPPTKPTKPTIKDIINEPGDPELITGHTNARDLYDLARGFMSVDLPFITSAAFRQSAPLAGKGNWFKAFAKGAKSFGSERTYNTIMDEIENSPLHVKWGVGNKLQSVADEIELAQSDMKTLTSREEQIRSTLAERVPVWGRYVKANNRAFTAFQNTIRTRTAEDWLKAAGAVDADWRITNMVEAKKIANTINELTGHGSLKIQAPFSRFTKSGPELNLERASDVLADIFWSPRLMARDMRMMNLMNYIVAPKLDRMKYLEGAVRRAGVWATFTGLANLLGASTNSNPTSADFGKARIGNTRLDAGSGLLQWIVMSARMALGSKTTSTSNKNTEFGSSMTAGTRQDALDQFLKNRLHPTLSLGIDLLSASKNKPFYPMSEVAEHLSPIPAGDIIDLMQSNPEMNQIIMGLVGSSLSMGSSTYGPREYGKPQFNIPGDPAFKGGSLIPK
jgi:hypothetical protein